MLPQVCAPLAACVACSGAQGVAGEFRQAAAGRCERPRASAGKFKLTRSSAAPIESIVELNDEDVK